MQAEAVVAWLGLAGGGMKGESVERVLWEYKMLVGGGSVNVAELNEMGERGWELVIMYADGLSSGIRVVFIFKRPIEEKPATSELRRDSALLEMMATD